MKIKIYFAHALSDAPEWFSVRMQSLKKLFEELHPECEILHFFGLGPAARDGDIILADLDKVAECDLLVGICDVMSIGLGCEINERLRHVKKPALLVAHRDWRKTRMVTGWPDISPSIVIFQRYDTVEGIIIAIEDAMQHFLSHRKCAETR